MEIPTAIALIKQLVYKPGWRFEAESHEHRYEGCIKVRVHYPAFNSNRDQAAERYPEPIETYATFAILAGECDTDDMLYRRLLDFLIDIEAHEAREFLRVPPTMWAPFHPHKIQGMRNWKETTEKCKAQTVLDPDIKFGVV